MLELKFSCIPNIVQYAQKSSSKTKSIKQFIKKLLNNTKFIDECLKFTDIEEQTFIIKYVIFDIIEKKEEWKIKNKEDILIEITETLYEEKEKSKKKYRNTGEKTNKMKLLENIHNLFCPNTTRTNQLTIVAKSKFSKILSDDMISRVISKFDLDLEKIKVTKKDKILQYCNSSKKTQKKREEFKKSQTSKFTN